MMSEPGYELELRKEGRAVFYSPKIHERRGFAPTSLPVFFNPFSKPNRDVTMLFLAAWFEGLKIRVCDALAGAGVRSIRMFLETDVVGEVTVNDVSPRACQLIKLNMEMNKLGEFVEVTCMDANELLAECGRERPRYYYVDIDPAGSPAPFIENGVRGCRRGGVIGVTATDMPALVGVKPESCLRKYDAKPLRAPFSKEDALRILAGFIAKSAARLGIAAKPILSFSKDHYIRVFAVLERGRRLANEALKRVGWISYCPSCLAIHVASRFEGPITVCESCGGRIDYAGPAWIGELTSRDLAERIYQRALESPELYRESLKLLDGLRREDHGLLGYHPINHLARMFGGSPVKPSMLVEKLRELGYRASTTHIDPSGVKTDAPLEALRSAFEELRAKKLQ
jgi:tRNA (guanine26-N2/guanine27-N2)-dimethyltransferase